MNATDTEHLFQKLRAGLVPERGLDAIAVGVEKERAELARLLDRAEQGEGEIKFLRGDYGCGKTFMARLATLDARRRGFATSFVVVSDNDTRFYKFEELYARIVSNLGTATCERGALGDVLDRWIGQVEEVLEDSGHDPDAEGFDEIVLERLKHELAQRTDGAAPPDFVRVVQTVFELKQRGDFTEAGALLAWLAGSRNVAAGAKRAAGVRGDISSRDAMAYLRGVLEIVKAAGYRGLLVVVDEAETILRSRKDTRHKSLNGLRQVADASGDFPGLLWLVTGTPLFFDSPRGVKGLPPLHDRICFKERGGFASLRQPQLRLRPFDATRLRDVGLKLRELYPIADRSRFERLASDTFIDRLVAQVTQGFKGDVGVVPRQFLRELVEVYDLVQEGDPDFVPMDVWDFRVDVSTLSPVERERLEGTASTPAEGDLVPVEDVW